MAVLPVIDYCVFLVQMTKLVFGSCACVRELNNFKLNKSWFICVYVYDMTFSKTYRDNSHFAHLHLGNI